MIPISVAMPTKQVSPVFQIAGTEKNKNIMAVSLLLWMKETFFIRYWTAMLGEFGIKK
jgi:hypothetical protein